MRYQFLRFPQGKSKAFTMSYDDGFETDIKFCDIINKYNLKCTFNLNNNCLRNYVLSDDTIKEKMISYGHEIAVHGEMHRAPGLIRSIEGIRDVLDCRLELEKRFNTIIRGMAYPDSGITRWSNNSDYKTIRNYLKDLDICYARTLDGDNDSFELPDDWYSWTPSAHHTNPDLMDLLDKFLSLEINESTYDASCQPRLFYLWGHSFEFDQHNNWDLLEDVCKKVSNRDEIWYATNMEIYNYVNAYNSLIYSADGSMIYNPTLYDLWFTIDRDNTYVVESGKYFYLKK